MAYAAVLSLKKTIERLRNTSCLPILTSFSDIEAAYKAVSFFKDELERLDRFSRIREEFDALASQIREAAWKLEDVLDLHELGLIDDDEEVEREMGSFCKKANELVMKCSKVEVMSTDDESSVSSESGETNSLSETFERESEATLGADSLFDTFGADLPLGTFCTLGVDPLLITLGIVGMAGIGKTTYALKLFQNSIETGDYNVHAFVAVGQKPKLRDVLQGILSQIGCHDDQINVEKVEELGSLLYHNLSTNRFIILLDDVWDAWFWKALSRFLPLNTRGNVVLTTTRRVVVAKYTSKILYKMPFLSSEESWELLYANAFQSDETCSRELMEVGKKIAEYCDGLPLAIIVVAKLLAKTEKTLEYWLKVANEETSVFEEASKEMSQVLLPSYLYLPLHLKLCFVYFGVFPCKHNIEIYPFMLLLEAEEFLEVPSPRWNLQRFVAYCLCKLISENVIIKDKAFVLRLHFSYWYLCVKEAEKNKFYKVIKRMTDTSANGIERERRLCILNNVLLGIKDTRNSLSRVLGARSVLCTVQLVKLIRLRYLTLTCDRKLPASISMLCNLQYLIVKEHCAIRHNHIPTYLPMEIWDMKELKHIEVIGADLPEPAEDDALLENLMTLKGVSGHTCTKRVLKRIPNIEHLVILMELSPSGTSEPTGSFNNFHYLRVLRALIYDVVNPHMSIPKVVQWPITDSSFPSSLYAITLSGQGYPWTMLTNIAKLPGLETLQLLSYACRGSQWTVSNDDGFVKLKSLRIEDTDMEHWEVEEGAFPSLEKLNISHCYKLKQLPKALVFNSVTEITLVECNPLVPSMPNFSGCVYKSVTEIAKMESTLVPAVANFPGCEKPIQIFQSFLE